MRSWWFQSPEGRIQLSIIAIRLALLAVVVFVSIVSVPPANWPAFILAVSGFYLSVLDPLLRRARLVVDQHSPAQPNTPPQRLRLKLTNYGQTPAYNCRCRAIELRTSSGVPVLDFSPRTLRWAQPGDPRDAAVTIQGYGDFWYLDLAAALPSAAAREHQYALAPALPLEDDQSPDTPLVLVPADGFVRLGIYADGVRNPPIWLQITAQGQIRRAAPPQASA